MEASKLQDFIQRSRCSPLSIKGKLSARRALIGPAASTGCGACWDLRALWHSETGDKRHPKTNLYTVNLSNLGTSDFQRQRRASACDAPFADRTGGGKKKKKSCKSRGKCDGIKQLFYCSALCQSRNTTITGVVCLWRLWINADEQAKSPFGWCLQNIWQCQDMWRLQSQGQWTRCQHPDWHGCTWHTHTKYRESDRCG